MMHAQRHAMRSDYVCNDGPLRLAIDARVVSCSGKFGDHDKHAMFLNR
eukprot:SAG11_NODE_1322_length_5207_cov_3.093187_5_plen_48_part_00